MRKKYDLICFDLDGTLVVDENNTNFWEKVMTKIGKAHTQEQRYKDFFAGKLNHKDWTNLDLEDWKQSGITKQELEEEIKECFNLNPGAKELIIDLKNKGFKLAIISGSTNILLDTIFPDHPFDDVFINELFFKNNTLDSWNITPYANDVEKDEALKLICERENIPLSRSVFIGDDVKDIPAAKIAGLSISYNSMSKELDSISDVIIEKGIDMREIYTYLVED